MPINCAFSSKNNVINPKQVRRQSISDLLPNKFEFFITQVGIPDISDVDYWSAIRDVVRRLQLRPKWSSLDFSMPRLDQITDVADLPAHTPNPTKFS